MSITKHTGFIQFFKSELKPKGKIITPFNLIAALTIVTAAIILFIRFRDGIGSVSHPIQERPWGLWINLNVITGVAFAGGAYVITFMVYILGLQQYKPIVRATVLWAFLCLWVISFLKTFLPIDSNTITSDKPAKILEIKYIRGMNSEYHRG